MSTSPAFNNPITPIGPVLHSPPDPADELDLRLRRVEDEVTELKDTVARFADLVLGEVKDLRKLQLEAPAASYTAGGVAAAPAGGETVRRCWLLAEFFHDIGTTFRMYLDPRYRVRRGTQFVVPMVLGLFALNCIAFNLWLTVPIVSSALEKIFDVLLAVLLYKVLSREIERYRQTIAQMVAWNDFRARRANVVGGEAPLTAPETG